MLLPVENWAGLFGSLLLLIAPLRDQLLRHRALLSEKQAENTPTTRKYWDIVASGYEGERNKWNFWDSASMASGAILIGASYVINAVP